MKIEYFFDVISPYSALSWKVLKRYESIWKLEIRLVPVFLGGVMKGSGNKPPATLPAKAMFQMADLQRNKVFFDVPLLDTPSNFFSEVARTVLQCQRVLVAAQVEKDVDVAKLLDAMTDAVHIDPSFRNEQNELNIDDKFLATCCERAGLSPAMTTKLLEARNSAQVKEQLNQNTKELLEEHHGFGSPTFFVHPENGQPPFMTFGSDRIEQLAFIAGLPYFGPQPSRPMPKL